MPRKVFRFAALIALSTTLTSPLIAESTETPFQVYLRQQSLTPVINHSNYVVPGGFVIVDWVAGGAVYYDPKADGKKLNLDSDTESIDPSKTHKESSVNGAISGIAQLLGYKPAVNISSASTFDFSGVKFNVSRISDDDIDSLIKSGPSHDFMADNLNFKVDMYLVQSVDYANSFTITTSSASTISLSTSGTADGCTAPAATDDKSKPAAPADGGTKPASGANPPAPSDPKAPAGGQTPATTTTGKTDEFSQVIGDIKTVEQLIPATKAAASTAAASTPLPSASLKLCNTAGNTTTFTNTIMVPTAMHLVYVDTYNGNLRRRMGIDPTVPMSDKSKLHRLGALHSLPPYWNAK